MKKKSMSNKEIILLLVAAGLIIGVILGFVVRENIATANDETVAKINQNQEDYDTINSHIENKEKYKKEIEEAKVYIKEEIEKYPSKIYEEDFLMWTLNWRSSVGIKIFDFSIAEKEPVQTFTSPIPVKDDKFENKEVEVGRVHASTNITASYSQLKEAINLFFKDKTSVDTLSISYDSLESKLMSSVDMTKYYVDYSDAEYEPVPLPNTSMGQPSLFGSTY